MFRVALTLTAGLLVASCSQSGTNVVGFDAGDCVELTEDELIQHATESGLKQPLKFSRRLKGPFYEFSVTKEILGGSAGKIEGVRQSATLQAGTYVKAKFNETEYNFVTEKQTSLNVMDNGFSCRILKH